MSSIEVSLNKSSIANHPSEFGGTPLSRERVELFLSGSMGFGLLVASAIVMACDVVKRSAVPKFKKKMQMLSSMMCGHPFFSHHGMSKTSDTVFFSRKHAP